MREAPLAAHAGDPDCARASAVNVLFVCIQNAGRSQIAEALFRRAAASRHEARSAGSHPASRVHPEVAEVMRELGSRPRIARRGASSEPTRSGPTSS